MGGALRVGYLDTLVHTRFGATAALRGNYLTTVAAQADSLWVPDHLNSLAPRALATPEYFGVARAVPRVDAVHEPWTMLGYLAARNIARRRLGVSVTDAGRRNPAVTAQAAATLNLLTHGRAILGIGTGEREGNEPYGVDWVRPVARLIEALATIRALWNSGGHPVSRDSDFFPLRNAVFDLPPYKGRWPELWVAAHGPRMLRATGRYGDGWFPAAVFDPAGYAQRLGVVRDAASDAGRDPLAVVPANLFYVVTGRSRGEVDDALNSEIMKTFALNLPAEQWAEHGGRHPLGDDFAGAQDLIPQMFDEQTLLEYNRAVPPDLIRSCILAGTPDEVLDQVAQWRDAGTRYAVICNNSFFQPSLRRALASTIPMTRILRGLRRL